MKMSFRYSQILMLLIFGCTVLLAGCGGGGGGSNSVVSLNPSPTATATIQMSTTSLQTNGNANVTATYTNLSGQPISGLQVNFATTFGSFNPISGSATTDATGTATIQLLAGSTTGSGTVTASATVSGAKVGKQIQFSVVAPQPVISNVQVGLSNLAPLGTTGITVTLTDSQGNPFTTPVAVSFTSNFSSAATPTATLISPVTSANGVASSTYTALKGAVGTDTITVSVGTASANVNVSISAPAAGSIQFVSASPANISLKGMGGAGGDLSTLVFQVLDTNGNPKAGQAVDFALDTTVGGLSLTSASASSDANGDVSTVVQSGTIATPVRVTATIHGSVPLISTQSSQLVVSTGIPAQDGLSISVSNYNPEAWAIDGQVVSITARLSDHFHNPVPDGTAVYFTTNGGSVQPSCITTAGACSVNWTSQNPRPVNGPISLVGRAVVLAYAIGEESFVDANGNGVADAGPCSPVSIPGVGQAEQCGEFISIPEAYLDGNLNGVRDPGEPFIDYNGNGQYDGPTGVYIGILRPSSVSGPTSCNIFYNTEILMSTSAAKISVNPDPIAGPGEFDVTVTDLNGNTMASGTNVTITVPFGTVSGLTNYTFPQNYGNGVTLPVFVSASSTPTAQSGFVQISVKSPSGFTTIAQVPISGFF